MATHGLTLAETTMLLIFPWHLVWNFPLLALKGSITLLKWLWVKTNGAIKWVGAPPILVYVSGDWSDPFSCCGLGVFCERE